MSALQGIERILDSHRDAAKSAGVARDLSKNLAADFGEDISDLRKWHTTQTEEDDYAVRPL